MNTEPESRPPIFNLPGVIRVTAIVTILIHVRVLILSPLENHEIFRYFSFIPARFSIPDIWQQEAFSLALSPLSYALLHADAFHLLMNMFFMLAFGTAVARRISWPVFALLYGTSAVAAAFFWMLFNGDAPIPLIGASGALSGAAGALVRMSIAPRLAHDPRYPIMAPKTAIIFGLFWIGMNLILALLSIDISLGVGNIAWEAHIGGFLFGFAVGRMIDGWGLTETIAPPPGS